MQKSKKIFVFLVALLLTASLIFTGCSGKMASDIDGLFDENTPTAAPSQETTDPQVLLAGVTSGVNVDYSDFDEKDAVDFSSSDFVRITLDDATTSSDSENVSVFTENNQTIVKITAGGTYVLSGKLSDGQIYVEAGENQVRLIFNGIDVTCSDNAPVYLNNGKKVVITVACGTVNKLADTDNYSKASTETDETTGEVSYEPNGALFSKKSLTINGSGTLEIDGNFNNGLSCKDELKIINAELKVEAVNNGIKGNDLVVIRNANITVDSEGDGIKSSKENDAKKGFVCICGGKIVVNSREDGIQAVTTVAIYDGSVLVNASLKGIKSDNAMLIAGGTVDVMSSSDDTLHANDFLDIIGGVITLSAKDDGIHADNKICIKAGDISVTRSYEGIEACVINVEGGNVSVVASDDGFNASNGTGGMGMGGPGGMGRPGSWGSAGSVGSTGSAATCELNISGGNIFVDASGDGLDSNGNMTISGGTTVVHGPTNGGNGILDSGDGGYQILVTGGTLIGAGTSNMLETPSTNSTQCTVVATLNSSMNELAIVNSDGETIIRFEPEKQYQAVIISSPQLVKGETYGLYTGSTSSGTLVAEFTISSILTTIGNGGGGGMGPGGMNPGSGSGGPGGGRPGRW